MYGFSDVYPSIAAVPAGAVKIYGGDVYASSNQITNSARFPAIAASKVGTQDASHASPTATRFVPECML